MARRWLRSPRIRNTFMVPPAAPQRAPPPPGKLSGGRGGCHVPGPALGPARRCPRSEPRAPRPPPAPPAHTPGPGGDVAGRPPCQASQEAPPPKIPPPTRPSASGPGRGGRGEPGGFRPRPLAPPSSRGPRDLPRATLGQPRRPCRPSVPSSAPRVNKAWTRVKWGVPRAGAWQTPRVQEVPLNVTINLGFNSSLLGAGLQLSHLFAGRPTLFCPAQQEAKPWSSSLESG